MAKAKSPTPLPPPAIQSLAQADQALRELGEIARQHADQKAQCDEAVAAVVRAAADKMVVEVDGLSVTYADRRRKLEADLEQFVFAFREQLFPPGEKKSLELNHGTIGLRLSTPKVSTVKGITERKALATLCDKFLARVMRALSVCRLGFGKLNEWIVVLKPALNKEGILSKYAAGAIGNKSLLRYGLCVLPGKDEFFCEPNISNIQKPSETPLETST